MVKGQRNVQLSLITLVCIDMFGLTIVYMKHITSVHLN